MLRSNPNNAAEEGAFDAPLVEIEKRLQELEAFPPTRQSDQEIARLKARLSALRRDIYARLTPWQKTLVARHPRRPYTLDFARFLFEDFLEIHGDRRFADDPAIITGWGSFHGRSVAVVGHQKGRDTKEKILRNFGMPRPEGYRKAQRMMRMAEKFRRPILSFVDTPGAFPGMEAEARGQAEAIATSLREMAGLEVPIVVTVTGEGGSGGALAIAVGNRVNMLEHAIYSVISPEGCAAILWKDQEKHKIDAARNLRYTAQDLDSLGIIDDIVPEVPGGAHVDHEGSARLLDEVLVRQLEELDALPKGSLAADRFEKFRKMGAYVEPVD